MSHYAQLTNSIFAYYVALKKLISEKTVFDKKNTPKMNLVKKKIVPLQN